MSNQGSCLKISNLRYFDDFEIEFNFELVFVSSQKFSTKKGQVNGFQKLLFCTLKSSINIISLIWNSFCLLIGLSKLWPKYLPHENVKNIISDKRSSFFTSTYMILKLSIKDVFKVFQSELTHPKYDFNWRIRLCVKRKQFCFF